MNSILKKMELCTRLSCLLFAALILTSCETTETGSGQNSRGTSSNYNPEITDRLHSGDLVTINFSGIGNPPPKHEERIKEEDGTITLPLIGTIKAEGKTRGELQAEIYKLYVNGKYYQPQLTVTVAPENRWFHVSGEVKSPGRLLYSGEITVLKAIATAGDFTDFANRKNVRLIRANGKKLTVNGVKALHEPSLDLPVFPGDLIEVPRRLF